MISLYELRAAWRRQLNAEWQRCCALDPTAPDTNDAWRGLLRLARQDPADVADRVVREEG